MEKYIYDKKTGLHYELIGDYYYPCLVPPGSPRIGVWGMRRYNYLREHKKVHYNCLLITGELNSHLEEIDQQAEDTFEMLVNQFKQKEGITEQLKADDPMAWIGRMNNIRNRAMEIINHTLIFT